jgi:anti-anti-sigma factor
MEGRVSSTTWTVTSAGDGAAHRVVVHGVLDMAAELPFVAAVTEVLAEGNGARPCVVIDLTNIEFIDSSGVRALMALRLSHGERVELGAMSPRARRVLAIAGLADEQDGRT